MASVVALSRRPCVACSPGADVLHVGLRCVPCGHEPTPPRTSRGAKRKQHDIQRMKNAVRASLASPRGRRKAAAPTP